MCDDAKLGWGNGFSVCEASNIQSEAMFSYIKNGFNLELTAENENAETIFRNMEQTPECEDADPLVVIDMDMDNLIAAVVALNGANADDSPFFGGGVFPISESRLQSAIVGRVHGLSGTNGNIISHTIIGPNTMLEYGKLQVYCAYLGLDPIWAPLTEAMLPLARFYISYDGKRAAIAVPDPVPMLPCGKSIIQ
jgi:hypothetical protein